MRGATRSAARFLFGAAQFTAERTGEVGTAPVGAEEDVAVEDGGVEVAVIAVRELDVGLIYVDVLLETFKQVLMQGYGDMEKLVGQMLQTFFIGELSHVTRLLCIYPRLLLGLS